MAIVIGGNPRMEKEKPVARTESGVQQPSEPVQKDEAKAVEVEKAVEDVTSEESVEKASKKKAPKRNGRK